METAFEISFVIIVLMICVLSGLFMKWLNVLSEDLYKLRDAVNEHEVWLDRIDRDLTADIKDYYDTKEEMYSRIETLEMATMIHIDPIKRSKEEAND